MEAIIRVIRTHFIPPNRASAESLSCAVLATTIISIPLLFLPLWFPMPNYSAATDQPSVIHPPPPGGDVTLTDGHAEPRRRRVETSRHLFYGHGTGRTGGISPSLPDNGDGQSSLRSTLCVFASISLSSWGGSKGRGEEERR